MPLGSSSAAPVMRPGPNCSIRAAFRKRLCEGLVGRAGLAFVFVANVAFSREVTARAGYWGFPAPSQTDKGPVLFPARNPCRTEVFIARLSVVGGGCQCTFPSSLPRT